MKTHATRIPPNYVLLSVIISSVIFWLALIKVFFGQQIKEWIVSVVSSII